MKWLKRFKTRFMSRVEIGMMIDKRVDRAVLYLSKRCKTCGSGLIKYEEWSPDGLPYYFCSKKCCNKWHKESGEIYRTMPGEPLKKLDNGLIVGGKRA